MPALALTQPVGVGLGSQEPFSGITPAANTNFSLSIDGRGLRRVQTLVFTLTTDGNAANRYVTVEYRGGDGNAYAVNAAGVVVTASSTQRFAGDISRGVAEWASGTDVLFPLAAVFMFPGDSLNVIVAGKQAGDTLTVIRGVLERFPLDAAQLPVVED